MLIQSRYQISKLNTTGENGFSPLLLPADLTNYDWLCIEYQPICYQQCELTFLCYRKVTQVCFFTKPTKHCNKKKSHLIQSKLPLSTCIHKQFHTCMTGLQKYSHPLVIDESRETNGPMASIKTLVWSMVKDYGWMNFKRLADSGYLYGALMHKVGNPLL